MSVQPNRTVVVESYRVGDLRIWLDRAARQPTTNAQAPTTLRQQPHAAADGATAPSCLAERLGKRWTSVRGGCRGPSLAWLPMTVSTLSMRQAQVLEMAARGLTNAQIAAVLGVTVHAVKFHLAAVYRKLGVTNRTQAVSVYLRAVYGRVEAN